MTEKDNLIGFRDHEAAELHFQELIRTFGKAMKISVPRKLKAGNWHTPLVSINDQDEGLLNEYMEWEFHANPNEVVKARNKISVGRCARVSYLTHDGRRDIKEDIALHDRLVLAQPLHASPAEHVAQALDWPAWVKSYPDLIGDDVDTLQSRVLTYRREHEGEKDMQPPEERQCFDEEVNN